METTGDVRRLSTSHRIPASVWTADKLSRIMIRHTKSQRIGGEALALPDCDSRTVLLDMSADERRLIATLRKDGMPLWLREATRRGLLRVPGSYGGSEYTVASLTAEFADCAIPSAGAARAARAAFDQMMKVISTEDGSRTWTAPRKMTKM